MKFNKLIFVLSIILANCNLATATLRRRLKTKAEEESLEKNLRELIIEISNQNGNEVKEIKEVQRAPKKKDKKENKEKNDKKKNDDKKEKNEKKEDLKAKKEELSKTVKRKEFISLK